MIIIRTLKKQYSGTNEIEQLAKDFNSKTLPLEKWTHKAHLAVGLWFVSHHTREEAILLMRQGIITYNDRVGITNDCHGGYHETLTRFWLSILHRFVRQNPGKSLGELAKLLFNSAQSSRDLPLQFYSRERLFSLRGRALWLEPDKRRLL